MMTFLTDTLETFVALISYKPIAQNGLLPV